MTDPSQCATGLFVTGLVGSHPSYFIKLILESDDQELKQNIVATCCNYNVALNQPSNNMFIILKDIKSASKMVNFLMDKSHDPTVGILSVDWHKIETFEEIIDYTVKRTHNFCGLSDDFLLYIYHNDELFSFKIPDPTSKITIDDIPLLYEEAKKKDETRPIDHENLISTVRLYAPKHKYDMETMLNFIITKMPNLKFNLPYSSLRNEWFYLVFSKHIDALTFINKTQDENGLVEIPPIQGLHYYSKSKKLEDADSLHQKSYSYDYSQRNKSWTYGRPDYQPNHYDDNYYYSDDNYGKGKGYGKGYSKGYGKNNAKGYGKGYFPAYKGKGK